MLTIVGRQIVDNDGCNIHGGDALRGAWVGARFDDHSERAQLQVR